VTNTLRTIEILWQSVHSPFKIKTKYQYRRRLVTGPTMYPSPHPCMHRDYRTYLLDWFREFSDC